MNIVFTFSNVSIYKFLSFITIVIFALLAIVFLIWLVIKNLKDFDRVIVIIHLYKRKIVFKFKKYNSIKSNEDTSSFTYKVKNNDDKNKYKGNKEKKR